MNANDTRDPSDCTLTMLYGQAVKPTGTCFKRISGLLQVAAGGKLFNVVVSDANTGKLVLDKGRLQRRVTIIPLDKIDGRKAPQHVQQAAAHVVS